MNEEEKKYIENYYNEDSFYEKEEKEEEHEWVDWKRQDDAQRWRDIQSEYRRPF